MAALLLLGAGVARAAEPDPAASMYQPGSVVAIDLTLPQASIEALEADPTGEYRAGTFSLATTDGTPAGIGEFSSPLDVGIRLKGQVGSLRPLGQKAAFKIKFSFVKGQKFLGLKKMTLNNMVQDASMLHEMLTYETFGAIGVPRSRTGYAFVRLNGEVLGVYLNVEDLDDVALEKRFGPFDDPQHLYEGDYGTDVAVGDEEDFEVDEGDDEDLSDLEALSAAVNDVLAPDWSERVEPHADLDEMARMWAVEKYVGHWDGYAGKADEVHALPNNYYLYSDPTGRFQMLPWGTDQTWEERVDFGAGGGLLFDGCLGDASCAATYKAAATAVLGAIPSLDLDPRALCTAELLAPWQRLERASIRPYGAGQIAAAVAATRDFIAERPFELAAWLEVGSPGQRFAERCTAEVGYSSATFISPPAGELAGASLQLGRTWISRGALVVRVQASVAGELDLRAAVATGKGRATACTNAVWVAAGTTAVRCPLSAAARERLAARWLKLRLDGSLAPAAGAPAEASAARRLARTGAPSGRPQAP